MHLQLHTARTEYLICRTDVKLHVSDVELLLVVMFHLTDLLLPIALHQLPFCIGFVFLRRHHIGRSDFRIAYLGMQYIHAGSQIILHLRFDIVGRSQIHTTARSRQILIVPVL